MAAGADAAQGIIRLIRDFVAEYPASASCRSRWQEPLVAFARADDPMLTELPEKIPGHFLPEDLLPGARSVVCYFLPFTKDITRSNVSGEDASPSWLWAYVETNQLITELNDFLSQSLAAENVKSVQLPPTHNFDPQRLISPWSHKHIASIAGLGRFGLHQMLITEKGVCGRLGSLIIDIPLAPTSRPEQEFCLERAGYRCGRCVRRCFAGALQKNGLDKFRCYERLLEIGKKFSGEGPADACGKCVSLVPCSFVNPVKNMSS